MQMSINSGAWLQKSACSLNKTVPTFNLDLAEDYSIHHKFLWRSSRAGKVRLYKISDTLTQGE